MDLPTLPGALQRQGRTSDIVRVAKLDDIPFILSLARKCYPTFNLTHAEAYTRTVISMPAAAVFMICGNAAASVVCSYELWFPDMKIASIGPLFGIPDPSNNLGTYRIVKAAIQWAKNVGCSDVRLSSEVGASRPHGGRQLDIFAVTAKRLGMELRKVEYSVSLEKFNG